MPRGVTNDLANEEPDRGPLVYQESKVFHSETFLCNVYDNTKGRSVTFEIYGLDTQDVLTLVYNYVDFDALFRFNAELMNPNRKDGRFHWVIERVAIVTVGKERRLQLEPEVSDEVPELPVYETNRKIPTGRMDLKERQRLREQMDMLDIKRTENIANKRAAAKQRFLKHIFELKAEDARRRQMVEDKIESERAKRVVEQQEAESREIEELARSEEQAAIRRKAAEVKEQRTEEQDEEEYRQLRLRWKQRDAEIAENIKEKHEKKERQLELRRVAKLEEEANLVEVQEKREVVWNMREERIRRKNEAWLVKCLEVKAYKQQKEKLRKERNQEFLKVLHVERQVFFEAQLERTADRAEAQEAEKDAMKNYTERRALPPKVNKKARQNRQSGSEMPSPTHDAKEGKHKGKKHEKVEKEADRTERVLDNIELKMRAEMEEERRRQRANERRDQKVQAAEKKIQDRENTHMKKVREIHRKAEAADEAKQAERRLVMQQREEDRRTAAERKAQEMDRLQRIRANNVLLKEQARLQAACA